jgi:hypothetical protein
VDKRYKALFLWLQCDVATRITPLSTVSGAKATLNRCDPGRAVASVHYRDGGRSSIVSRQQAAQCWECEAMIDHLVTVALRIRERQVARLVLCQRCFDTRYLPLASSSDAERGEMVIVPTS